MNVHTRRRSVEIDGIIVLNKPVGMTSNAALGRVKRLLRAKKAGHTGSLDPAATGMLPLCFGEATKVAAFLLDADKTYRVTARLGGATDTGDADGEIVAEKPVPELSVPEWQELLGGFVGRSEQIPPMFSALKRDGKRLYELARRGEVVDRPPRSIEIREITLVEARGKRLVFRVRCSKGTYVRTLVEDIAARAGTVAHTRRLHRECVAGFPSGSMLSLASVARRIDEGRLRGMLRAPDTALGHFGAVSLDASQTAGFCQGQAVKGLGVGAAGELARVYGPDERFLGLGELDETGVLAPKRVFRGTAGPELHREAGDGVAPDCTAP